MNIIQALDDANVFGGLFRGGTWDAWRTFLAALFALPLTPEQLEVYQRHTGRSAPPPEPAQEAWLVCGRRAGKSLILATIAVFLAAFCDWRPFLGPGELATIMIIARDRRQARVIKRFITGLLHAVPMLKRVVESESAGDIALKNSVVIEIHTASFRAVRGYTIVAALLDEIAFWPTADDAADPDTEVINAIRPGMATIPGSMLLCASSPYARRGSLWDAHRRHFGKDGDPILVWQATTREMNATVPESVIAAAIEEDPAKANAEYMAVFRSDVEAFVSREVVNACISTGVYERAPMPGVFYKAFLDFAGGSGQDSMTLAIGHRDDKIVVIDALREVKPPFSPEFAVGQFAQLLRSYRIYRVAGDGFGGEFCREPLRKHSVSYEVVKQSKSELYGEHLLPMLNSGRVDLLDHPRAIQQIIGLECYPSRNRDKIDHGPGAHDDLANCIAGAVARVAGGGYRWDSGWLDGIGDVVPKPDAPLTTSRRPFFNMPYISTG
jgi:hypothetical protein